MDLSTICHTCLKYQSANQNYFHFPFALVRVLRTPLTMKSHSRRGCKTIRIDSATYAITCERGGGEKKKRTFRCRLRLTESRRPTRRPSPTERSKPQRPPLCGVLTNRSGALALSTEIRSGAVPTGTETLPGIARVSNDPVVYGEDPNEKKRKVLEACMRDLEMQS